MKGKFVILVAAFLALTTLKVEAQIDLTLNPVSLLFGGINVGADFVIADNFSLEAVLGYRGGKDDDFDLRWSSVPVMAVGKYYFSPNRGADRFYANAFLRYVNRDYSAEDQSVYASYKQSRFGLGFGVGYKIVSAKGIVFDVGFGAGRAIVDNTTFENDGQRTEVDWPDLIVTGKLAIGYRFGGK